VIVWRWAGAFARFWLDYVFGDDWTVAAVIAAALFATWRLVDAGVNAWWLLPPAVLVATAQSLRRAARREGH
jgi:hypothetical protein